MKIIVYVLTRTRRSTVDGLGIDIKDDSVFPVLNEVMEEDSRDFAEYVLDGRDEDGIRYLLRISGDQMA